jgi:hypothetical protein
MGIKSKRRGLFFSIDALIAMLFILLTILLITPIIRHKIIESKIEQDIIVSMSSIKIGEINNSYVKSLISQGIITDLNKSLLEQVGEFFLTNKTISQRIAQEFLDEIEVKENIGLWLDNSIIATKNTTSYNNSKQIQVSRQIVSGIKEGQNLTGFSARSFLLNTLQNKYHYFGGFIGEGDLELIMNYGGNISSATLEIAINNNFNLYINNIYQGNYQHSINNMTPITHQIPITNFNSGQNLIELRGNQLQVMGGFLKISYKPNVINIFENKRYIVGVKGFPNMYDSIDIPGNLTSMEIFFNLDDDFPIFINIGNTTVFENFTIGATSFLLDNNYLSSVINYDKLNGKTTPFRIGKKNISLYRTYDEQRIIHTGNPNNWIFSDSYIDINYTKPQLPFGIIITAEKQFDNSNSGTFTIPSDAEIIEAKVVSYPGQRWTHEAKINGNVFYNLSLYGQDYHSYGDPRAIRIPKNLIDYQNTVQLSTISTNTNITEGSSSNKIIYTIARNLTSFSPVLFSNEGCRWEIQFEDNTFLNMSIPSNYSNNLQCKFTENQVAYNMNNALHTAIFNLLTKLDINLNNKVDVKFGIQDIQIESSELTGVPYTWSSEIQARKWV